MHSGSFPLSPSMAHAFRAARRRLPSRQGPWSQRLLRGLIRGLLALRRHAEVLPARLAGLFGQRIGRAH